MNEIKINPKSNEIFIINDKNSPLRGNHIKGHIKDNVYVKHIAINKKPKIKFNKERQQRLPRQDGQQMKPRR